MNAFFNQFLRVTLRNKTFSILNILGLAIGMAGFILIMLWVSDELSYDKYNENASRILRIQTLFSLDGNENSIVVNPAPMAATLKSDFPEVENTVRFRNYGGSIIRYGDNSYSEKRIIFADSTVFDVFTIPFISGNPTTALRAPGTITLSESMANKYFGTADPVGKMLTLDDTADYQITGVFRDIPSASHFHFDFIASIYSNSECYQSSWVNFNFVTYVLLKENVDENLFEEKLSSLVDGYLAVEFEQAMGSSWDDFIKTGAYFIFEIQKLEDIHLYSNEGGELGTNSDIQYVYIFVIIAIFILVIACINFTNLSTAKASVRTREVGLKKMFGEVRGNLAGKFLLESLVIVIIAFIIAISLVMLSIPYFNGLAGKALTFNLFDSKMVLGFLLLIVISALLAGSYPAIYLSSFSPIAAIKREMFTGRKRSFFRNVLVTGQFVISLILLMSTLLLMKQMTFIQQKKLGYDKENLIVLKNTFLLKNSLESFKEEILQNPSLRSASVSGYLPIPSNRSKDGLYKDGIKGENVVAYQSWRIDHHYIQTLGLEITNGRDFSKELASDSSAVILNEAAARSLGWDDPIGQKIGKPESAGTVDLYTVVGVVKDFNYESVHVPVEPLVFFLKHNPDAITLRFNSNTDLSAALGSLQDTWNRYAPQQPFEYTFIDQTLSRLYTSEQRLGKILGIFTGLAFFVSGLGLFGLALFTTEQRRKEIGIRKVNGSGVTQIIGLLSFDFTKLILVAFVIATPVAYYIMQQWLENFAYHTSISWWIFILTGLISYIVTMITIGFQSYRAATVNPVETLKYE